MLMGDKDKGQKIDVVIQDEQAADEAVQPEQMPEQAQEAAPEIDMEALRAEVSGIIKEKEDALTMLRQVSADFDNYKKRNAQARVAAAADAKRDVIAQMLPVVDNLERALLAAKDGQSDALTTGVDMVLRQFIKAIEDLGVQCIDSQPGTPFDPERHDAVAAVPADDEHPDNTVFDTLQKGYKMDDKVIRYAMVRVSKE